MESSLKVFYEIFADLPSSDYDECVAFLKTEISAYFVHDYHAKFNEFGCDVVEITINGYDYLFDISSSAEMDRDARIVGAYGKAVETNEVRDHVRMKGFIGQFSKIEKYKDYDKGHFIAHKINGNLDQNLYPQLKELNRGWSSQGKLFRAMERYCQNNPEAFVFTRPVYSDLTWIPAFIDYGVFTKEQGLLLNRFNNRKMDL